MGSSRRKFLGTLGAGLVGSAGFLAGSEAEAFGSRRRRGASACVPAGPLPTFIEGGELLRPALSLNIQSCYPNPVSSGTGGPIPIYVTPNGYFCAWGTSATNVVVGSITAVPVAGGTLGAVSSVPGNVPATGASVPVWSFIIGLGNGLAAGTQFNLSVAWTNNGQLNTTTWGTFAVQFAN